MPNKSPYEIQNISFEVVHEAGDQIATISIPALVNDHLRQSGIVTIGYKANKRFDMFELFEKDPVYSLILGGRLEPTPEGTAYTITTRPIDSPPPPTSREAEHIAVIQKIEGQIIQWLEDITVKPYRPSGRDFEKQPPTVMTERGRLDTIRVLLEEYYKSNPQPEEDDDLDDLID